MANLKTIKSKIKSVSNLKKITRALEIVSTVKLQKLKDQADALKSYLVDLMTIVSTVGGYHAIFSNNTSDVSDKTLAVIFTSERWLCGWLNSKLLRKVTRDMKEKEVEYFVIGKKGLEYFKRVGANIVGSLSIWDNFEEKDLLPLFTFFDEALSTGSYGEVKLYFNYFKNSISQVPTSVELFPLTQEAFEWFLEDIEVDITPPDIGNKDLMVEPSLDEYMVELRRQIRNFVISSALVQNKTWEHAARMIAMKNAKDNATDMAKSLKLSFNKARQWAITQEISEIVSAKIAIED